MENVATLVEGDRVAEARMAAAHVPVVSEPAGHHAARAASRIARRLLLGDIILVSALTAVLGAVGGVAWSAAALLVVCTLASFGASSLYATARRPDPAFIGEARRLLSSVLMGSLSALVIAAVVSPQVIDRQLALAAVAWVSLVTMCALISRRIIRRRSRAANPERILIVGAGVTGQNLARRIGEQPHAGRKVVGFVDEDPFPLQPDLDGIPVFSSADRMSAAIERVNPDRIILAFTRQSAADVLEDLRCSEARNISISVVPRYHEITPPHAELSEIDGVPLIDIHSAQLSRGASIVKRAFDITLAGGGLLMLSPLLLGIAVAIKATSKGPVFFGQLRTGRGGRTFRIWKFRTMVPDAEAQRMALAHLNDMDSSAPLFKMRDDPRITPIGRFLRKYSLDELPQLFNVVNGTMSLVGPRPFVVHEADQMQGWSRRRLDLTPGITGLWQVRGRNEVPYEEMIRLDCMYVANWSPLWDLRLLLETIPRVISGRGAS